MRCGCAINACRMHDSFFLPFENSVAMIPLLTTWGHSSAGRAPAWHAGGRRFDPAWLHQHPVIRPIGWMQHTNSSFRASPSSRGLGHHPFTVATGVRIPVGTPVSKHKALTSVGAFCLRRACAVHAENTWRTLHIRVEFGLQHRGAIAQLGERLHGMQEVGGSIPPGSTNIRSLGRSDGCSIQIQVFVRPHRLEA